MTETPFYKYAVAMPTKIHGRFPSFAYAHEYVNFLR